jgi:molybdopterin/thiamine biosynthesis adenylyltransferase
MYDFVQLFDHICKTENCKELSDKEIGKLKNTFPKKSRIWEIESEITYKGKSRRVVIYLCFKDDFPFSIPKIYINRDIYEKIKYIPHINDDLTICIFDESLNNNFPIDKISELVDYMIHQAKSIIRNSEDEDYNSQEFIREFKAYWGLTYGVKDKSENIGLHLIHEFTIETIKCARLNRKFNGYEYVAYNEGKEWDSFKEYLKSSSILFEEVPFFVVDYIIQKPPYKITFKQSISYLKADEVIFKDFKASLKKNGYNNIVVIYLLKFEGKIEVYGWTYNNLIAPLSKLKGTRKPLTGLEIFEHHIFGSSNVLRISFDNLTNERLQLRTTGFIEEHKSVSICGLGSVGSNLIHFLKNTAINKFHLVDNETLKIENINRHYLGFQYVNYYKADSIKQLLRSSNPLWEVEAINKKIQNVIDENPEFIFSNDYLIVCIGDTLSENYILNYLIDNQIKIPIIIFWVESFLASGQMLYINPNNFKDAITSINNFKYNVLSEANILNTIYLKEGSCQSGYFPYSSTNLMHFLSALFPYLRKHISDGYNESTLYTWIGNKDFLKSNNLILTEFADSNCSFDVVINRL